MKFNKTTIPGVCIVENDPYNDCRGSFLKVFYKEAFSEQGLEYIFEEMFFSVSAKGVIRGIHFQGPPNGSSKLLFVPSGSILSVALDIRKGSPAYGDFVSIELSDRNNKSMFIPEGCASGFLSLNNNTNVTYLTTALYQHDQDYGIRWDSFGMKWGIEDPILSERDKGLPGLNAFNTPFCQRGSSCGC